MRHTFLLGTLVFAAALAGCPEADRPETAQQSTPVEKPETRIWQENNDEFRSWQLMPGTEAGMRGKGWHTELATVRLNPVAFGAVEAQSEEMPVGAVLIKENLDAEGRLVDIVAIEKQQNGWFWARYSPEGRALEAGINLPSCLNCHSMAPNDSLFTWRKPLPAAEPAENEPPEAIE